MHLLYRAALAILLLLSAPWWAWRMLRSGKYRAGMPERLGRLPARIQHTEWPTSGALVPDVGIRTIWVHAVSVGEVLAIRGLVEELRRRFPDRRVVVSTTTATGQKLARERFGEENVFYFPLDFGFAICPYLRALRPELILLAETEFWPNFLRLAKQSGARIAVVNARISDRSFPRYHVFQRLLRPVLNSIDLFLAQSEQEQRRLIAIGAKAARVQVSGNLKFDIEPPRQAPFALELKERIAQTGAFPVLVCGSTVEGEEPLLLSAFRDVLREHPNALMLLAPRHPERFEQVGRLLASSGVTFWRRSQLQNNSQLCAGILLLDSIGELASTYSLATVAFVGGSLVPRGGHNILEPAFFSVPIVVGPHTENFRDIVGIFRAHGALREVSEPGSDGNLIGTLRKLIENRIEREALGRRAAEVLARGAGATARSVAAIEQLLSNR